MVSEQEASRLAGQIILRMLDGYRSYEAFDETIERNNVQLRDGDVDMIYHEKAKLLKEIKKILTKDVS